MAWLFAILQLVWSGGAESVQDPVHEGGDVSGEHAAVHVEGDLPIVFLIFSLLVGAFIRDFFSRFRIPVPYTVMLLLIGMLFGGLNVMVNLGPLGRSIEGFSHIDPHLLLLIFLPPLIFESALMCNFHIFWREIGQAMLLAGPGVCISIGLTSLVCMYMFDYEWDVWTSLMFGAAVSATDPVAVVAVLREIGASPRLATLIEAESLLNDGTAYVAFLVFLQFSTGEHMTGSEVAIMFTKLALGGVALGFLIGIPLVWWIRSVFHDALVETTLTIAGAYLIFYLAEAHAVGMHVSGVLAVVTLGLYVSKHKTAISPDIEESLHHVWETISYMANTILFIFTGIVVAMKMQSSNIRGKDAGFLLLLYVMIHIIRAITIGVLSPCMQKMGYGLNWRTGTVLVYGGLRGAVGLALGLIVESQVAIPLVIRDRVLFHIAGIVFLTLLINGTTTGQILALVGLTKVELASSNVYHKALKNITGETSKLISSLKVHRRYGGACWVEVQAILPHYGKRSAGVTTNELDLFANDADAMEAMWSVRGSLVPGQEEESCCVKCTRRVFCCFKKEGLNKEKKLSSPRALYAMDKASVPSNIRELDVLGSYGGMINASALSLRDEISHRFISIMLSSFHHQYEEGLTTRTAVQILIESCECALDNDDGDGVAAQWELLFPHFEIPLWLNIVHSKFPKLGSHLLYSRIALALELASSYLEALQNVASLHIFFPELEEAEVTLDLINETKQYRSLVLELWKNMQVSYPAIYHSVQTKHAAQYVLTKEKHHIEELFKSGVLKDKELMQMRTLLKKSLYGLEHYKPQPDKLQHSSVADKLKLYLTFYDMIPADVQRKLEKLETQIFNVGDNINEMNSEDCNTANSFHSKNVALGPANSTRPRHSMVAKHRDRRSLITRDDSFKKKKTMADSIHQARGVHVIIRGIAIAESEDGRTTEQITVGAFVGIVPAMTGMPFPRVVEAQSIVESVFIPVSLLAKMAACDDVLPELWKICASNIIGYMFMHQFSRTSQFSTLKYSRLCQEATFIETYDGQTLLVQRPMLILSGRGTQLETDLPVRPPRYIDPDHNGMEHGRMTIRFVRGSQLIVFPSQHDITLLKSELRYDSEEGKHSRFVLSAEDYNQIEEKSPWRSNSGSTGPSVKEQEKHVKFTMDGVDKMAGIVEDAAPSPAKAKNKRLTTRTRSHSASQRAFLLKRNPSFSTSDEPGTEGFEDALTGSGRSPSFEPIENKEETELLSTYMNAVSKQENGLTKKETERIVRQRKREEGWSKPLTPPLRLQIPGPGADMNQIDLQDSNSVAKAVSGIKTVIADTGANQAEELPTANELAGITTEVADQKDTATAVDQAEVLPTANGLASITTEVTAHQEIPAAADQAEVSPSGTCTENEKAGGPRVSIVIDATVDEKE